MLKGEGGVDCGGGGESGRWWGRGNGEWEAGGERERDDCSGDVDLADVNGGDTASAVGAVGRRRRVEEEATGCGRVQGEGTVAEWVRGRCGWMEEDAAGSCGVYSECAVCEWVGWRCGCEAGD